MFSIALNKGRDYPTTVAVCENAVSSLTDSMSLLIERGLGRTMLKLPSSITRIVPIVFSCLKVHETNGSQSLMLLTNKLYIFFYEILYTGISWILLFRFRGYTLNLPKSSGESFSRYSVHFFPSWLLSIASPSVSPVTIFDCSITLSST